MVFAIPGLGGFRAALRWNPAHPVQPARASFLAECNLHYIKSRKTLKSLSLDKERIRKDLRQVSAFPQVSNSWIKVVTSVLKIYIYICVGARVVWICCVRLLILMLFVFFAILFYVNVFLYFSF